MSKMIHLVRLTPKQLEVVYHSLHTTIEILNQGLPLLLQYGTEEEVANSRRTISLLMETSKTVEPYLIASYETEDKVMLHPDYDPKREY